MALLSGYNTGDQNLSSLMDLYNNRATSGASNYDPTNSDMRLAMFGGGIPNEGYNWAALGEMYNPNGAFNNQWLSAFDSTASNPTYTNMYGPAPTSGTDQDKLDWMSLVNYGGTTEANRQTTTAENAKTDMTESALMAAAMAGVGGLALSGAGLGGAGLSGAEGAGGLAEGFSYGGGGIGSEVGGAYGADLSGFGSGGEFGDVFATGGEGFGGGADLSGFGGGGEFGDVFATTGEGTSSGLSVGDLSKVPTGIPGGNDPDPGFEGYGGTPAGSAGGGMSLLDTALKYAPLLGIGGSLLGAGIGAYGANKAADTQAKSAQDAQNMLWQMYQQNRTDLEPWRQAGVGALGNLTNMTTPGKQFDAMQLDPGYQFRLGEGTKGIDRGAAARGRYYTPATMMALDRYNQNFASNEFGNIYNRNANLAGLGQVGTTAGVNAGQNTANNMANLNVGAGNARASGYMGVANALSGGLGGSLNYLNQLALMDALRGSNAG